MNNQSVGANQFRAMSWNVGTDSDFQQMNANVLLDHLRYQSPEGIVPGVQKDLTVRPTNEEIIAEDQVTRKHRDSQIQGLFSKIQPGIICLQEAPRDPQTGNIDIVRLKSWLGDSYDFRSGDNEDTLVAWDTKQFALKKQIETPKAKGINASELFTIVDLEHKDSKKVIRAISGHFQGCMNTKQLEPDAEEGTRQMNLALKIAESDTKGVDVAFFGCDANVEPEHPRINILKNSSYTLDGEHRPTNFNARMAKVFKAQLAQIEQAGNRPKEDDLPEFQKKVDHVAIRAISGSTDVSFEFPRVLEGEYLAPVGNPKLSPSDHAPIVRDITINNIGFFKRFFGNAK